MGEVILKFRENIWNLANPEKASLLQRFFKTGKGEYAEGDVFLGISVPDTRKLVDKFWKQVDFTDIQKLLNSSLHEERLFALLVLVKKYEKEKENREKIYRLYLKNTKRINNWDLVDITTPKIIGRHLLDKPRDILYQLAGSKNLWEKRISIISTFAFIKEKDWKDSISIAEILLFDKHDLIHKAVGWTLREVGKVNISVLERFLEKHIREMPRTMLRYSIEKFPENKRQKYLKY